MTEADGASKVSGDEAVAHRLEELAAAIDELRADVRRSVGSTLPRDEDAGWDADEALRSHSWVSTLGPARPAAARIPRLPLELLLIAGAAVLAGVADLKPLEIAAVMAAAWLIVALAEWAGSRGDRLRAQVYLAPVNAPAAAPTVQQPDPTWFTPPVEHTLIVPGDDQSTAIAVLPPVDDPETTAERRAGD